MKNAKNMQKVVTTSKKEVSDEQLLNDLSDLNIENLISKIAKGRSIWKVDYLQSISTDTKKARRKVRNEQLRLSKILLHTILTKQSKDNIKQAANALHSFYKKSLNDSAIYSNVSEKENKEKFTILKQAYEKMKLFF